MAKYIPKSRNVDELIFVHSGGRLDISDAFHSFQLEEDLFADSVKAKFTILDASDSFNKVDFDGTETIELKFASPDQDEIDITLQVYKTSVTPDPNSGFGKVYEIFAVTPEHFTQSTLDVNKGYIDPITSAVEDVFGMLGTKRPLDIHATTGVDRFIIPGMTPYEAMVMLQRRAYSSKYSSSVFTFYESIDGFNFHNVEELIANNKEDAVTYAYSPTSQLDANTKNRQFMIEKLDLKASKDVLYRIKSGSYANQCKKLNLIDQTVESGILLVNENFGDFEHLDDDAMSYDSKEMIKRHLSTINSTKWIHETRADPQLSTNFESLIPARRFYSDSLKGVEMTMTICGNSDLRVGKVINLDMMEQSAKTKAKDQEPKVSGKYLINRVLHYIDRKEYSCLVSCMKESYNANVENPEKNVVA